jgi:1,3-beta-glucanosyltransferase GAS5
MVWLFLPAPIWSSLVSSTSQCHANENSYSKAFWTGNTRFYIRGIDYQPGGASKLEDPLADTTICKRDIPMLKALGVNTIRVYITDNSKNHDECMQLLADAGIYLVVDVNSPPYSINRKVPHPSYNAAYLQSVFATVDAFIKYDHTLAFFSGNEVINDEPGTTKSAPYVKAVTRDIKNYINSRKYRQVPVGYSAADVSQNRMQTAQYMNCGSDDARSDFFAFVSILIEYIIWYFGFLLTLKPERLFLV